MPAAIHAALISGGVAVQAVTHGLLAPLVHIRKQLRDALRALLLDATDAGSRVYVNRRAAVQAAATPCLFIAVAAEEVSALTMTADALQTRVLTVVIEACVSGAVLDDAADDLALQVERHIHQAGDLDGLLTGPLQLLQTRGDAEEISSPPVGVLSMAYQAEIITAAASPDAAV